MKVLNGISKFGKACKNVTYSSEYNVTSKVDSANKEKPYFVWHTEGNFSFQILKLAAASAIVATASAISKKASSKKK